MRLLPMRAVKACAAICALTLTSLSPLVLTPPAGADEAARPAAAPAAGDADPDASARTIDLLGITDLHGHISRTTQTDRDTGQASVSIG